MTAVLPSWLVPAVVATLALLGASSTTALNVGQQQRQTRTEHSSSDGGRSLFSTNSYYGDFMSSVFSKSQPNHDVRADSTILEDLSKKRTTPSLPKKAGSDSEKKGPRKSSDGEGAANEESPIEKSLDEKEATGENDSSKPTNGEEDASRKNSEGSSNNGIDGSNSKKTSSRSNIEGSATSSKKGPIVGSEPAGKVGPKKRVNEAPGNNMIADKKDFESSIFAGGEEERNKDDKEVHASTKSTNDLVASKEESRVDQKPSAKKASSTAGIGGSTLSGSQPSIQESEKEGSASEKLLSEKLFSEGTANGKVDENDSSFTNAAGSFADSNEWVAVQESTIGDITRTYDRLPHRNADGVHGYNTIKSGKGSSKNGKGGKGKGSMSSSKSKSSKSKMGKGGKGKGLRSKKKSSSKDNSSLPPSPSPSPSPQSPALPSFRPSSPSPPSPTPSGEIQRIIPNVLLSYVDAERRVEPAAAEYNELAELTVAWFELNIADGLADGVTLTGTDYSLELTSYGSGYPDPSYNILYSLGVVQFSFSQSNDATGEPSSASEIDEILRTSVSEDYIRDVVRQIDAFADITEAYFESTHNTFERLPENGHRASPESPPKPPPKSVLALDAIQPKLGDQAEVYRVRLPNIFLAYQAIENFGRAGPPTEPSAQEYKQQVKNTIIYLEQAMFYHLRDEGFSDDLFRGAKASVGAFRWKAGIPNDNFNVYIGLENVDFLFAYKPENVPDEKEIYQFLQEEVSSQDYIVAVWQVPGTFESVVAAVLGKHDH